MEEITIYREGLLHLIFLLFRESDKIALIQEPSLAKIFESEDMDNSLIEEFWNRVKYLSEPEIFNKTIELIKKCTEDKKIRAFTLLFTLAKCSDKFQKREIQLLQYTCQLTINELIKIKLSLDEQTLEGHRTENYVYLIGGYEIDLFILKKLLNFYLHTLSIHTFLDTNKFLQALLSHRYKPNFFILIIDPIRYDVSTNFEKVYGLSTHISIYIVTSSTYLLSRSINLTNYPRIKGIFEMPISELDIKRIALENNLCLKEEIPATIESKKK